MKTFLSVFLAAACLFSRFPVLLSIGKAQRTARTTVGLTVRQTIHMPNPLCRHRRVRPSRPRRRRRPEATIASVLSISCSIWSRPKWSLSPLKGRAFAFIRKWYIWRQNGFLATVIWCFKAYLPACRRLRTICLRWR